jgi:hypothetical protein
MPSGTQLEQVFWQRSTASYPSQRAAVRAALEFALEQGHDPLTDARIQNAVQAACSTQPTEGYRQYAVWTALGHDFGTPQSLEWALQRHYVRLFSHHPAAVAAITAGDYDFPPLRQVLEG